MDDGSLIYGIMALAYFLGAIPFGILLAPLFGAGDLRSQGSGNIGATNALRVGGKKFGALVLILDALKGVAAVLLAKCVTNQTGSTLPLVAICTVLVVLGHCFPVWLKFRGGKGVATAIASAIAVYWPVGLATIFVWIVVFWWRRISSLAAIIAMLCQPAIAFIFIDTLGTQSLYACLFISILVIFRHKSNISRMIAREEGGFRS